MTQSLQITSKCYDVGASRSLALLKLISTTDLETNPPQLHLRTSRSSISFKNRYRDTDPVRETYYYLQPNMARIRRVSETGSHPSQWGTPHTTAPPAPAPIDSPENLQGRLSRGEYQYQKCSRSTMRPAAESFGGPSSQARSLDHRTENEVSSEHNADRLEANIEVITSEITSLYYGVTILICLQSSLYDGLDIDEHRSSRFTVLSATPVCSPRYPHFTIC